MDDMEAAVRADGDDRSGRAYGRAPASYDKDLAQVGPRTPMGELLRRYWQPFALSSEINNDLPLPIRILGEDLVAFRNGDGKAGLMYPRCMHRGADLVYGKLEPEGIRCPYHGWMFDTEGRLLDTPCELDPTNTRLRRIIRQPWYPVIELHGLAFTYMGPPEKEPLFPRVPTLFEELGDDEQIVANGGSKPARGWPAALNTGAMDYNWLQYYENFMDPLHLSALHFSINGNQFDDDVQQNPNPAKFRYLPDNSGATWIGHWQSPRNHDLLTQAVFQCSVPNMLISGPVFSLGVRGLPRMSWIVPVDDTNFRQLGFQVAKKQTQPFTPQMALKMYLPEWGPGSNKEPYVGWSFEELQRWQTDYLVQKGLGPINLQSDEHLTTADAGVSMLRRVLKQQAALVAEGKDPIGARPGEAHVIEVFGGTAHLDPKSGSVKGGYARWTVADY